MLGVIEVPLVIWLACVRPVPAPCKVISNLFVAYRITSPVIPVISVQCASCPSPRSNNKLTNSLYNILGSRHVFAGNDGYRKHYLESIKIPTNNAPNSGVRLWGTPHFAKA